MKNKPNYTLRRIIVATPIIIFVILMMMKPSYSCEPATHIVRSGETLWGIAEQYCDGTIGDIVYKLSETHGSTVYPDQIIVFEG